MAEDEPMGEAGSPNRAPRLIEKMAIYEHAGRLEIPNFADKTGYEYIDTGLLCLSTGWKHTRVSERVFRVTRTFSYSVPATIEKWTITLTIAESIYVEDENFRTPEQVFEVTLTEKDMFVGHEYIVDESKTGKSLSIHLSDSFCDMCFSVTKCSGLHNLISVSTNIMEKFELANVVIELSAQKFYFVFETLALNSKFFYEKWVVAKEVKMPENGYTVTLDDSVDLEGFAEILKLLIYPNSKITCFNVECILATAKQLNFEMVLIWCEDFLIESRFSRNAMDERITKYLAQEYDLAQLQHKTISTDSLISLFVQRKPCSLKYITSGKFDFPEMQKKFYFSSVLAINANRTTSIDRFVNAMFPWKLSIGCSGQTDMVHFSLKPDFFKKATGASANIGYSSLNYSIEAYITIGLDEKQKTNIVTFSPGNMELKRSMKNFCKKRRVTCKVSINIRSVKGLRYYMNPVFLRDFGKLSPSSTVILRGKDGQIFVNLNLLAAHSDYFKEIVSHLDQLAIDQENHLPIVEIENTEVSLLKKLAILIYPNRRSLTEISAYELEDILPIADRLLFPSIKQQIEKRFTDDRNPFGIRTLQVAIDYHMHRLKENYLRSLDSITQIHKAKEDPAYKDLSEKGKLELHRRFMALPLEPSREDRSRSPPSRSPLSRSPHSPVYIPDSPNSDLS